MSKLLTEDEIQKKLTEIKGWERQGNEIKKKFKLEDFVSALIFVNKVGELAESMNHHPDIFIHGYKFVTLTLTTHSTGGLTRMDFDLAKKIDAQILTGT